MKEQYRYSAIAGLLLAGAGAVHAADEIAVPAGAPSTVVVTASRSEQQVQDAPASISVITREEIREMPAATLADILARIEGVSVVGADASTKDIVIRGMPGDYTLIMIDGRRQGTRETMNRGTAGVQSNLIPPLEAIERIEVIRGPMSSLYGSDAMGGVINIITRKVPGKWGGSVQLGGIVQQEDELGDTRQGSFWLSGPLAGERLALRLTGKVLDREEDRIVTVGAPDTRDEALTARLSAKLSEHHSLDFETGKERFRYSSTPGYNLAPNAAAQTERHERAHWALTHDGRYGASRSKVSLYQERAELANLANGAVSGARPELRNTVLDALLSLRLGDHALKLGGQATRVDLEGIAAQDAVTGLPANVDAVRHDNWAVFAEDDWFINERLTLTAGLRLDDHETYGRHTSPRLYAVYKLGGNWTLRGGAVKGFKAPTIRQSTAGYCMSTGGNTGRRGILCGNPLLEPEASSTQEAGLRYDAEGGRSFSATLFRNDFRNKVVSYDTGVDEAGGARDIYIYDNVAEVALRGVELGLKWPLARDWSLTANYSYTESERGAAGETSYNGSSLEGFPLDMTPKHMANAQVDWKPGDRLRLYARAQASSEQFYAGFRTGANGVRVRPGSTVYDLGGSWQFSPSLSLNAAVLNVGNKMVPVDTRPRATLTGNWMQDEGRRLWLALNAQF